jgi:hypothetical protein
MATATLVGKAEARRKALESIKQAQANFGKNVQIITITAQKMLESLTPVNTGQAVRNYVWTIGAPNSAALPAIDNGPPGPTNSMPLGQEPRRHANEEAADATLLTLNMANPFQTFICSNVSPDIEGLELGILPGPPWKSRSPNGMFGLVHQFIVTQVNSKGMLK